MNSPPARPLLPQPAPPPAPASAHAHAPATTQPRKHASRPRTAPSQPDAVSACVRFFLELQAQLRIYHWQTRKYARHKASDELLGSVTELSDRFVEVLMGKLGGRRPKAAPLRAPQDLDDAAGIVEYLEGAARHLAGALPEPVASDAALASIRDEIVAEIRKALYLFTLA